MTMVLATAEGLRPLGDPPGEEAPSIAVLPGDDIVLHRLMLLESTPKRRLEEARMRATDLAAQPIDDLHVAVGPADAEGASWVAVMDRERMAGHLAVLKASGAVPRHVVPAAMLLDAADGNASLARLDERVLVRTADYAGLVETELAGDLLGPLWPGQARPLADFSPATPEVPPLDLLQGAFEPRLRWWRLRAFQIPAAVLTLLLLLLLAAPALIERARGAATIAAYDEAVLELAATTLGKRPADAAAGAAALAAARREAEGGAAAARLSYAASRLEPVPGARLERADTRGGEMKLGLGGAAEAVNQASAALLAGPFDARRQGADVVLGERRAGIAATPSALSAAMLRFVGARADAALVTARRSRPAKPPTPAELATAFAAVGLADATVLPSPAGTSIEVSAARSTVLLPLLADLELRGARFAELSLRRNQDETVAARIKVAP
jgi:general secretion pathway protein L